MEHWHIILITTGVQIMIGLFMTIIGFLLKRSIAQIDRRLQDGDEKFEKLETQLAGITEKRALDREYFAKEYVSKDDFVSDVRALDARIQDIARDVKRLLIQSGKETEHAGL